jgi:iron-sulfur cluster repair protein YtfE (RIC family)
MKITKNDMLEKVLEQYPKAVSFLQDNGVVCFVCGEPSWGTLEEIIGKKGLDVDSIINQLNLFLGIDS